MCYSDYDLKTPVKWWYIFVQILAYTTLILVFKFIKNKVILNIVLWLVWLIEIPIAVFLHLEGAWYVSGLAFPAGVTVAFFKDWIMDFLNKYKYCCIYGLTLVFLILFFITYKLQYSSFIYYAIGLNILSLMIGVCIMSLSPFFQRKNNFLEFTGKLSLELYVIHLALLYLLKYQNFCQNIRNYYMGVFIFFLSYPLAILLQKLVNKIIENTINTTN